MVENTTNSHTKRVFLTSAARAEAATASSSKATRSPMFRFTDTTLLKAAFHRTVQMFASDEKLTVFSAGDSRCLMVSDTEAAQLLSVGSPDHSGVGLTHTHAQPTTHARTHTLLF